MMATIIPHGVLFRGGAEKAIREGIIKDGIIEAIVSLPPHLFYGSGIPACVLIINKNKPREFKDKILFINADAEYGEGRNQNYLRPEDIEKIVHVFKHKLQIPKYSRLVDLAEIQTNEFNLNIRRYVDNSPDPEIEDVKAHLQGGTPKREVALSEKVFTKYALSVSDFFADQNAEYYRFKPEIKEKSSFRDFIERHPGILGENGKMAQALDAWWKGAEEKIKDFPHHNRVAEFRRQEIERFKQAFSKIDVLDDFQEAGIFVNWWESVKYDLKTIVSVGWSPSLIPDDYIKQAFFAAELAEIEAIDTKLAGIDSGLSELLDKVEIENENEEEAEKTPKNVKTYLKQQIKSLEDIGNEDSLREAEEFKKTLKAIETKEKELKAVKKEHKDKEKELVKKVEEKKASFSEAEARELILKKFHDGIRAEMERYLNAEKKKIVVALEKLWDKYQIPLVAISKERDETSTNLNDFLKKLNYLK
jgi:type I restriction enzyme M protein